MRASNELFTDLIMAGRLPVDCGAIRLLLRNSLLLPDALADC